MHSPRKLFNFLFCAGKFKPVRKWHFGPPKMNCQLEFVGDVVIDVVFKMVVNWNAFVSNGLAHSFILHVNIMNVLSLYGNSVSLGNQLLKINKCHAFRISPTVWSEYNVESHAQ